MTTAEHAIPTAMTKRPADEELDLFGITHVGKIRSENQDHFLVSTVHPEVIVHATSLAGVESLPLRGTRLATLMLVADGVGGSDAGSEAARVATEAVMRYVASTLRCYHAATAESNTEFLDALRAAALEAHDAVRAEAATRVGTPRMATTLTMAMVVWPSVYVVQVGDSRCYVYTGGVLHQMTRDQTVAQGLVEQGVLSAEQGAASPLSNILASSVGGSEAVPEVTRMTIVRDDVILLCSDGLTKHVPDAEIAEHVRTMTSSRQLCEDLLALALKRGGVDNVTIVAGRAPVRWPR